MHNKVPNLASPHSQKSSCNRCGVCCLKGGPALHRDDLPLLESSSIKRSQLVTLCAGELVAIPQVRDEAPSPLCQAADPSGSAHLQALCHDVIKIKGRDAAPGYAKNRNNWTCVFYQAAPEQPGQDQGAAKGSGGRAVCLLHPNHPLECRLLDCHDPSELLSAYEHHRLSRSDISSPTEQAIQQAHAQGLRWDILGPELAAAKAEFDLRSTASVKTTEQNFLSAKLEQALLEAARFDQAFRELLLEHSAQDGKNTAGKTAGLSKKAKRIQDPPEATAIPLGMGEELLFHLGRPVPVMLQQFALYISPDARAILHRPSSYI